MKIDLKDAYYPMPVKRDHQKYLQFLWGGKLYQFICLCFGLSCAPWAFTKLLRPFVSFLRRLGIRLVIFLDDILILNETKIGAEKDFATVKGFLISCGFFVNEEKSVDKASNVIEYLGSVSIGDGCGLTFSRPLLTFRDV